MVDIEQQSVATDAHAMKAQESAGNGINAPPFGDGFELFQACIFRVEIVRSTGKACSGTAFTLALAPKSLTLWLATAKHVVEFARGHDCHWSVQQFDEYGAVTRDVRFRTFADANAVPPYTTHNSLDVAIFCLPARDDTGTQVCRKQELVPGSIKGLLGVSTGTRVGWAGFPGSAEQFIGAPQLCYFEGVVSAMVNRPDRRIYLVDGHVSHGASGGPVWHYSESASAFQVVGIVAAYGGHKSTLPGFCVFEPINPLLFLLQHWKERMKGDSK